LRNHNAVNKSNTPDLLAAYAESAKNAPYNAMCDKFSSVNLDAISEHSWLGSFFGSNGIQKMDVQDRRLPVKGVMVESVEVVWNLGAYFDSRLRLQKHVSNISRTSFYHMRRLRSPKKRMGREPTARPVSAFILSRLDYCNAILAGLPSSRLAPL